MKARLLGLLLAVTTVLGVAVLMAAPASAYTVISVNVVVTTTQCPAGGSVSRANASITDPGIAGSSGSSATATVYNLKTWYGYRSLIQGSNFCQTSWIGTGYYSYWSVYRYVYGSTTYI
jgi:hypothetical protein